MGADVGDAGAVQQPKLVGRPKIDFHRVGISLGMGANSQQRQNHKRNSKQFTYLPPPSFPFPACVTWWAEIFLQGKRPNLMSPAWQGGYRK
jgi:hypothetical protein